MPFTGVSWTEERVELLTRMWAEGYSARQIASQIPGATRSAIIGKAHRLNLQRGISPAKMRDPEPRSIAPAEPPKLVLAPPDQKKEWWQCLADNCTGTRQRPWDFCAPCMDKDRRANRRAGQFDTVRTTSTRNTPLRTRRGAA